MRDSMTGLRPAAAPTRREAIAALGALGAACALPARLALAGGGTEAQADVAVLDGDSATLASDWYERTGLDKDDVIAISLAQSAPAAYDAASVTGMGYMFARCTLLTSADTSSWPDELVDMLP